MGGKAAGKETKLRKELWMVPCGAFSLGPGVMGGTRISRP